MIVSIAASAMSAAIAGLPGRQAKAEQAEARHQHHAGQGVERLAAAADARVVRLEIGPVPADEVRRRGLRILPERRRARRPPAPPRSAASSWCGWCGPASPRRPGRSARSSAPLTKLSTASLSRNARMKRVHAPSIVSSFRLHAPRRIGATSATRASSRGSFARCEHLPAREPLLGARHHLDHALVGFARIRPEGEDAVLEQDQAFDLGFVRRTRPRPCGRARSPART